MLYVLTVHVNTSLLLVENIDLVGLLIISFTCILFFLAFIPSLLFSGASGAVSMEKYFPDIVL